MENERKKGFKRQLQRNKAAKSISQHMERRNPERKTHELLIYFIEKKRRFLVNGGNGLFLFIYLDEGRAKVFDDGADLHEVGVV